MKKLTLLITLLVCYQFGFSQDGTFFDDFDNNYNRWYSVSANQRISFSGGKMHISVQGAPHSVKKGVMLPKTVNQNKDFSFSCKQRLISGVTGNGVIWNWKDENNYCKFLITDRDRQYAVYQYVNGELKTLVSWRNASSINKDYATNTLGVERVGSSTNLYVNGTKINTLNITYNGHRVGVFFGGSRNTNKMEVDNFSITSPNAQYVNNNNNHQQQVVNNQNTVSNNTDKTAPEITIIEPSVSRGFKIIQEGKQITVKGRATDQSGIFEITINGQEAHVDAQGYFSKTILLAYGENAFYVKATDVKQNSSDYYFIIERKSDQQDVADVSNTSKTNNDNSLSTGKYYALIIGNNSYTDPNITSLDQPINDAQKLYNVLTREYTFAPQNVTFLKNATYVQMIEAFDRLSNKITPNDNLLVFYAGHGWWDDEKQLGYWLPSNAKKSSTAFWIRNSTISDYMSSINTKHTLLIADACFSGSIFKTRSAFSDAGQAINSLYKLPSRTAMTSGNLKEVPDQSVFLQYLVKRLDENSNKYLPADQLFSSFRIAVMNNSRTEPQFGTIQNAGDEGGEFIFVRKY